MLSSLRWLVGFVLFLTTLTAVSAQTLTFTWPKYPEANVDFSMEWTGGTPPYTVYVLTSDESKYYYEYTGSGTATAYDFPLDVGTEVVFQCRDSGNLVVTSPVISVIATLELQYPPSPTDGSPSTIQWGGGVSPYTIYVLTADESKYYFKYTGAATSAQWTPNLPDGTEVIFQAIDSNGVKATSDAVTVSGGTGTSTSSSGSNLASISVQSVLSVESVASVSSLEAQTTSTGGALSSTSTQGPATTNAPTNPPSSSSPNSPTSTSNSQSIPSSHISSSGTATLAGGSRTSSNSPTQTSGGGGGVVNGGGGGKSTNVGAIAGGVVGGVFGLALLALLGFLFYRHNQQSRAGAGSHDDMAETGAGAGIANREPTVPNVGPTDGGPGAGQNPFTPELQSQGGGGGYGYNNGAGVGGGGGPGGGGYNNPDYYAAAGAAGVGAAGGYFAGQQQQRSDPSYQGYPSGPGSPMPTTPAAVSQNISYSPHPQTPGSFNGTGSASGDPRSSMLSEGVTSLPYAHTGGTGTGTTGSGQPFASAPSPPPTQPHGWRGLPEVQS